LVSLGNTSSIASDFESLTGLGRSLSWFCSMVFLVSG
jgi:hypothetical protein